MGRISELEQVKKCSGTFVLAVNDTLNVMTGKWKLPIMGSLHFGKKRFKEIAREIPKITPRMLSKELKDLEMSGIVNRTVDNQGTGLIQYGITSSARELEPIIIQLFEWAKRHRKKSIVKK